MQPAAACLTGCRRSGNRYFDSHQEQKMTDADNTLLEVNNIEVVYNDIIQVLRGVSLKVPRGSIVSFVTVPSENPLWVVSRAPWVTGKSSDSVRLTTTARP